MENDKNNNYDSNDHDDKIKNDLNLNEDHNKEQFEEFSSDQPNFNANENIADKYYGGENRNADGFLENSEFNEANDTFKPNTPEYEDKNASNEFDKLNNSDAFFREFGEEEANIRNSDFKRENTDLDQYSEFDEKNNSVEEFEEFGKEIETDMRSIADFEEENTTDFEIIDGEDIEDQSKFNKINKPVEEFEEFGQELETEMRTIADFDEKENDEKENIDDISESGYDKKMGMQKRDDYRLK